jgi:hypothetical protein
MDQQHNMNVRLSTPSLMVTRSTGCELRTVEDSPGSSIFDLPVQHEEVPSAIRHPQLPPITPFSSGSTCIPSDTANKSQIGGTEPEHREPSYLVISGGTGCNSICAAFDDACYVLPVSDDGGSSSEIIRVLGGPSIGVLLHMTIVNVSYWMLHR